MKAEAELDAALANLTVGEMTPDVRRKIEAHASRCDACGGSLRELNLLAGVFRGLARVQPRSGFKEAVLARLRAGLAQGDTAGQPALGDNKRMKDGAVG